VVGGCFLGTDHVRFRYGEEMVADTFPAGLRVLAVEDDRVCRKVLERQLKYYNYNGVCSCLLAAPISPNSVVIQF
jgi:hypothetical protein